MWTAKDNGNDISWGNAVKYCQNLRLAEFSDWRLPLKIDPNFPDAYDWLGVAHEQARGMARCSNFRPVPLESSYRAAIVRGGVDPG